MFWTLGGVALWRIVDDKINCFSDYKLAVKAQ